MVKYDPEIIRDFINRVTSSPAVRFKISGKVEHVVNGGGTLSKVLSDI